MTKKQYFIIISSFIFILALSIVFPWTSSGQVYKYILYSTYFLSIILGYILVQKRNIEGLDLTWSLFIIWALLKFLSLLIDGTYIIILPDLIAIAAFVLLNIRFIHKTEDYKKDLKEANYLSYHDYLTGLSNRRFINQMLDENNFCLPVSIIMADIDNLKYINDNYGHVKGDEIIKRVAEIIESSTREKDIVGRFGGDEFIVILPQTDYCSVKKVCQRITSQCDLENNSLLSITTGFAEKHDNESLLRTLKRADKDMYKDK